MITDLKPGDLVTVTRKPTPEENQHLSWNAYKEQYVNELCVVEQGVNDKHYIALRLLGGSKYTWYFPLEVVRKL